MFNPVVNFKNKFWNFQISLEMLKNYWYFIFKWYFSYQLPLEFDMRLLTP